MSTDGSGTTRVLHSIGDASDVADFLRRSGGTASSKDVNGYVEQRLVPIRQRSALEQKALEKSGQARNLEKARPEEAISLYRESIKVWKEIKGGPAADYIRSRLDHDYNRLTLVLEKCRRYGEALAEIEGYTLWRRNAFSPGSDAEAISKRQARLKKRFERIA